MTSALTRGAHTTSSNRDASDKHPASDLTAVVLDECDSEDVDLLLAEIGDTSAGVAILVTRHPTPPCVFGLGSGMEAMMMWNECWSNWRANVDATKDRVRVLEDMLAAQGRPVETIDCYPTMWPFHRLQRREIDGAVYALKRLQPARIIIDDAHHLASELRKATKTIKSTHAV